jgi:hypothetical protein
MQEEERDGLHVVRQLLDVSLLLGELLAQLLKLLLLALADRVVLAGALASLEGVAVGVTLDFGWPMYGLCCGLFWGCTGKPEWSGKGLRAWSCSVSRAICCSSPSLPVSQTLAIRPSHLQRRGIDGVGVHAPPAAGLGRRAGVAGAHGAGSGRKGPREQRRAGKLGDGSAHHCGDWLW